MNRILLTMDEVRWWMACEPHVRALRDLVRSKVKVRDVEELLHKCVSLYMADIHDHSLLENENVLLTISGDNPVFIVAQCLSG